MNSESGPDSCPRVETRLFDLSEYEFAFARFVKTAIDELMIRKSPVLSRIKPVPSTNIPISRNTMPSGEVIENKPIVMALPFPVDFNDAVAGTLATITLNIESAAEDGLNALAPRISEYMGRLCEAAGTATDAGGSTLSHDLILKTLENVDLDFNDQGEPDFTSTILTTGDLRNAVDVLEVFKQLPPRTVEEEKAWVALIDRKKKEFNDRRRHRRLS